MPHSATLVRALTWLPRGNTLPEASWQARHRGLSVLSWLHVPVLAVLAASAGEPGSPLVVVLLVLIALTAAGGSATWAGRAVASSSVTVSLLLSTSLLIHLFHGMIELHFHFFVVVALIAMYQAWTPYLLGVGFVLTHHAVMGLAMPMAVYNHAAAMAHPVAFAVIHGGFVLAESLACLSYWKVTEQALDGEREVRRRAEDVSRELAAANREISDLLSMMSHDLRAPLAVINGCAEMALDSWPDLDDVSRKTFMGKVQTAGLSLGEMLEETLTLSMVDADALAPHPTAVRLDGAVHEVLAALGEPLTDVDLSGLHPATVRADRQQLKHVLTNLVTNARKYGAPPFAVSCYPDDESVHLHVDDSGPGVVPEFVPRLFDRYARSDAARAGTQRGTGLGLYLVRELAVANGGETWYEPRTGGGSRFVVTLPAAVEPLDRVPARSGPGPRSGEAPVAARGGPSVVEASSRLD